MMKVTILGSGAFGLALAQLWQQDKAQEVWVWTPFTEEYSQITTHHCVPALLPDIMLSHDLHITMDLVEALASCDLLVVAVPSQVVRSTLKQVQTIYPKLPTIIVSKGIEIHTGYCLHQVYQDVGMQGAVGYLAGPTFAIDVVQNVPLGFTLATTDEFLVEQVQTLFAKTNSSIEVTSDLMGVAYCSTIKNMLAILTGAIHTRFVNNSTDMYYFTKLYQEACCLLLSLGAEAATMTSFAGLGDMLLTCHSATSRNYHYGSLLVTDRNKARKFAKEMTVEGLEAFTALQALLIKQKLTSPVISFLKGLLDNSISIDEIDHYIGVTDGSLFRTD